MPSNKPAVLFLCTHNAGRSQMARCVPSRANDSLGSVRTNRVGA
jgi:protein-tyrosine-phosphatase